MAQPYESSRPGALYWYTVPVLCSTEASRQLHHLPGHRVLRQERGSLGTLAGDARGVWLGGEHVQGPLTQLPLRVVVVTQAPHPEPEHTAAPLAAVQTNTKGGGTEEG